MIKRVINGNSPLRVKLKSLFKEVDSLRSGSRVNFLEINSLLRVKRLKVINSLRISNETHVLLIGRAQNSKDDIKLVTVRVREPALLDRVIMVRAEREAGVAREQGRSVQESRRVFLDHVEQFCEDAPNAPHVDRGRVVLLKQNQLRRSVPARDNVPSQLAFHVLDLFKP